MIYSRNSGDPDKIFLTEASSGAAGVKTVYADSSLQTGAEDMTPSELFQAALACCTNMTLSGVLHKRGIPFEDIAVDVRMEQIDGKTILTRSVKVTSDAPAEQVEAAIERAKNSFMTKVLNGEIEVRDV